MSVKVASEFHPVSLECWKPTNETFIHANDRHQLVSADTEGALKITMTSFDEATRYAIDDVERTIHDPTIRIMAEQAILGTIGDQAMRNSDSYTRLMISQDSFFDEQKIKREESIFDGSASPAEFVSFLHRNPELEAVETARLTHVGNWAVRNVIDAPVRRNLDASEEIESEPSDQLSKYKIKQFKHAYNGDGEIQRRILVERKRNVRTHFGGKVLTVVRNSLLVNYDHPSIPDDVRAIIMNADPQNNGELYEYDYNQECAYLREPLEDHITNKDVASKPDWALPLITTYYSVLAEARRP
jgi:hypothetical protein